MQRPLPLRFVLASTVLATFAIGLLGWFGFRCYLTEATIPPASESGPLSPAPPLTDRLVIVLVDALREDAANDPEIAPLFARLAATGASGVNITPPMTLTLLSVACLGTGMTPPISWSMKNFDAEPFQDENVFSLLKHAGLHTAFVGDASWTQLFGAHADYTLALSDHGFFQGIHNGISEDDLRTLREADTVLANPKFSTIVIHVVSADKTAHQSGARLRRDDGTLTEYARAVLTLNQHLTALYDRHGRKGTWLLVSDHGCTVRGNHGGGEEEARRAPFALAGPGIARVTHVEQPLTTMAPTLLALFGVRAPRTAETAANLDILTLDPPQKAALRAAHVAAREQYLNAALGSPPVGSPSLGPIDRLQNIALQLGEANRHRGGFRTAGVAFGLLAVGLLMAFVLKSGRIRGAGVYGLVGALASWGLLAFGSWQFKAVAFLGEPAPSVGVFLVRAGGLVGLLSAVFLARRWLAGRGSWDWRGSYWLVWLVVVLLLGQSVMRWPYGPLPQMYRAMVLLGLGYVTASLLAQRATERWRWASVLGLVVLFYAWAALINREDGDFALSESPGTWAIATTGYAAALIWLAASSLREDRRPWLWLLTLALATAAAVYHATGAAWMIKPLMLAAMVPVVAVTALRLPTRVARNVLIAVALILTRSLAVDARLIALIGYAAIAIALSGSRSQSGAATAPMVAVLVVLGHQSYFYETGYSFSFSALDMTVAFAATRDAINLGEGFVFLMLQHLGTWLVPVAALVYYGVEARNTHSLRATALAVIGTFLIQAWGAFASFEYEIDNHWFTMHAVPLLVFSLCNAWLAGLSFLASTSIRLPEGDPTGTLEPATA